MQVVVRRMNGFLGGWDCDGMDTLVMLWKDSNSRNRMPHRDIL